MSTYEVNDDLYPYQCAVFIRSRWGNKWYSGSGAIVGNNDILTASHVIYDNSLGGLADEVRVYPSYDPDNSVDWTGYYKPTWLEYYDDWDANGDGLITDGDGKSGSLYEGERDIALLSLTEDIGSIYGYFGVTTHFSGGTGYKLGFPGKYSNNLMFDEGIIYEDHIDNFFWFYNDDIEINPGDSGGPIYINSEGSNYVVGVVSSGDYYSNTATSIKSHYGWLSESVQANNYLYDNSLAELDSVNNVDEGKSISFTFKTHKSEEDKQYTYTLSGISSLDIASNELSGKTTINSDGEATFTIGISADKLTEGTETLTLSIGEKTKSISINDTSKTASPPTIELPTSTNSAIFLMLEDIGVPSLTINENITSVYTYTADEEVTWSLSASASSATDYTKFTIDSSTGALTFNTAPDYENPVDENGNNLYCLNINATDADGESSSQELWVQIWDVENEYNYIYGTATGTNSYEKIEGTSDNDAIYGLAGLDNIFGYGGDDVIDGGTGFDTVTYSGKFNEYSITTNSTNFTITDNREGSPEGIDTISNVELFWFSDQKIYDYNLNKVKTYSGKFSNYKFYNKGNGVYQIKTDSGYDDITGIPKLIFADKTTGISAIADIKGTFDQVTGLNTDSGEMFRLYNAAFARFPDADGLKYWIDQFSSGRNTRRVIAQSFLGSTEFTEMYGSNVSDETYVNNLYKNVLGRDADAEGLNYWVGNLSSGLETRYEALLGFAESAENKALFTEMTGFG